MEIDVLNRRHDEARQGESFSPAEVLGYSTKRKFYIESYGCAMNFADSEVVASILQAAGFTATRGFHRGRSGPDQYLFDPGKSRTNRSQPAAYFPAGKKIKSLHADRRTGLYGRKIEIKISGRRKTR